MRLSLVKHWFQKENKKGSSIAENTKLHEEQTLTRDNTEEEYQTSIEYMTAFFAHEFRNPLTSIIGFTQFLEQHETVKGDESIAQYISIIKEESLRMNSLIQELLSLSPSRFSQDNLSIIDVKYSLEKIVAIYQLQSKEKLIHISTDIPDNTYITGNTGRFERVFVNLIKNAIEAVEGNGTIDISAKKEGGHIIISIIDTGPGFKNNDIKQVFTPFYTTKDDGTGIGLPICKATIESFKGTIEIRNHPTLGAHVEITLPHYDQVAFKA